MRHTLRPIHAIHLDGDMADQTWDAGRKGGGQRAGDRTDPRAAPGATPWPRWVFGECARWIASGSQVDRARIAGGAPAPDGWEEGLQSVFVNANALSVTAARTG